MEHKILFSIVRERKALLSRTSARDGLDMFVDQSSYEFLSLMPTLNCTRTFTQRLLHDQSIQSTLGWLIRLVGWLVGDWLESRSRIPLDDTRKYSENFRLTLKSKSVTQNNCFWDFSVISSLGNERSDTLRPQILEFQTYHYFYILGSNSIPSSIWHYLEASVSQRVRTSDL